MEAAPQVLITLILLGQDGFWSADPLIWTSFAISIFASVFGIAKLLKNGPIKMVRKDGKMGGYGTPGFILVMVVVACNMVGKATWIALAFGEPVIESENTITLIWIWALSYLLPQLLLTLLIWLVNVGFKTTCQFSYLYPSYFLLGIFSPFVVSTEVIQNGGQIKTMTISQKWTWINMTLSMIGSISGFLAYHLGVWGRNDVIKIML